MPRELKHAQCKYNGFCRKTNKINKNFFLELPPGRQTAAVLGRVAASRMRGSAAPAEEGWRAGLQGQWQPSGRHRLALRGSAVSGRRAESFGGLSAAPARPVPGTYRQKTAFILSGPSKIRTYRQPGVQNLSVGRENRPYRQKEGCFLSENPLKIVFDLECWLGHPLFLGPRDYHWRGLTSSVRQVSRKSPSGAKKVDTYPPKLPIFSPKARQVSKKIAYNGVFVDTCFWNGIWPGQAGARREPSKLSAAPPLSAEPRIARRWCPPTARPTAPCRATPQPQPPPSRASARRREEGGADSGGKGEIAGDGSRRPELLAEGRISHADGKRRP